MPVKPEQRFRRCIAVRQAESYNRPVSEAIAFIRKEIVDIRKDIEVLRQETRADIERLKSDLLKWMFGALIAQGGLVVALIKLL